MDYDLHIEYINNNLYKMKTLLKLEESDIDNIVDINDKILLLIYYNYLEKIKSFSLDELNNVKSNDDENIYLFASRVGQLEIMKFLEEIGFDIHITSKSNYNAFLIAIYDNHLDVIKYLLEEKKGFDININPYDANIENNYDDVGYSDDYNDYIDTISSDDIDNNFGINAFLIAIEYGHLELTKYLVVNGCNIHMIHYDWRDNGFTLASRYGRIEIMKYLKETDIDTCFVNNVYGDNAFGIALSNGQFEIMQYLIFLSSEYDKINIMFNTYVTKDMLNHAYSCAVRQGNIEIIKYVIENGCDVNIKKWNGSNEYIYASIFGHLEIMKYLEDCGIDTHVRTTNKEEYDAFDYAVREGHIDIVKYLIEKGHDINIINNDGDNAYTIAACYGNYEIMMLLETNGANIHNLNKLNYNAFLYAVCKGNLKMVKYLVDKRLDINIKNKFGMNAYEISKLYGYTEILKYLEEQQILINF
jgi:ankyrin repeat protein